ncbi:ABC transporter G family member 10 [Sesamum angolense]|uniref:ABC transporter G family member 10 n=1 Tax=Sesamum angolense TaxID=2727404 RepID=A0AAE1WRK8_9LAMI|nr:ABC transporter G family member 10 [Sesamum angolense]
MELPVKKLHHSADLETHYNIQVKNLSYKLSPGYGEVDWFGWKSSAISGTKYVLKNISCEVKSGELTAIAGPSGAGKTTLLEILAGTMATCGVSGHVLVNDMPMNAAHFRRVSGYVTQDEALFPHLTVEETLMYSARLRLQVGRDKARSRVHSLLTELGLEHIAGVRIGSESSRGISGGEKRRVSIGVDLVHDPVVLLLDEPTSGLDSASALHIVLLLKSMAKNQGKTIVLTIHQPGFRILNLIDKVILLSNGVVLHGGSLDLLAERLKSVGYCIPQHVNALEFAIEVAESLHKEENHMIKIESCGEPDRDETLMNQLAEGKKIFYCNSPCKEVVILSQRFCKNIFRTKQLLQQRRLKRC